MIRRLFPQPDPFVHDVMALVASDRREGRRPWVMVNMITSIDGATASSGSASGLTGPDDQALFHAFRAVADVVLVGAATVRAEGYGPVALPEEVRRRRLQSGRTAVPRLAVLSRRLDLDPDARFFRSGAAVMFWVGWWSTSHRWWRPWRTPMSFCAREGPLSMVSWLLRI